MINLSDKSLRHVQKKLSHVDKRSRRFADFPNSLISLKVNRGSFIFNAAQWLPSLWFIKTTHFMPSIYPTIQYFSMLSLKTPEAVRYRSDFSAVPIPNHNFHFKSRLFKRQQKSVFVYRNNQLITLLECDMFWGKKLDPRCVTARVYSFQKMSEWVEGDFKMLLIDHDWLNEWRCLLLVS